jgi:capsular polysaccharide biosynthesis protein
MELRTYWAIIWRRIWLVALILGVVLLYIGYQYYHLRKTPGALTAYQSTITFQVGLKATTQSIDPSYADNVIVSENLADTLVTGPILTSNEFDTQVSHQIAQDMTTIVQRFGPNPDLGDWQNAGAIGGALNATHVHSLVTVNVTWSTPIGAWAVATAIGEVSANSIGTYLDYVITNDPSHSSTNGTMQAAVAARVISNATDPARVPGTATSKELLDAILFLVALIIAIALAFLADYLDDRIRSKEEAISVLELPIYGEIPRAPVAPRSIVGGQTKHKDRSEVG